MTDRTKELECVIADLTLEAKELRAELEALKRQVPSVLPGGPVLGIDWTPLYAAPVPQVPSVLPDVGEILGIGESARSMSVIKTNINNMQRRSACLSAIENEFFTITKTCCADDDCEPGDEGTEYTECLLNWADEPSEYVERFRSALSAMQAQSVPDGWKLVPKVPTQEMVRAGASAARAYMQEHGGNSPHVMWSAMLAAAPQPERKNKEITK